MKKWSRFFRECFSMYQGCVKECLKKLIWKKVENQTAQQSEPFKSAIEKGILLKRDGVYSLSGTPST